MTGNTEFAVCFIALGTLFAVVVVGIARSQRECNKPRKRPYVTHYRGCAIQVWHDGSADVRLWPGEAVVMCLSLDAAMRAVDRNIEDGVREAEAITGTGKR